MITVYYKKSCGSSKKALKWLDNHGVKYKLCQIELITKKSVILALSLTDNGVSDILKLHGDAAIRRKITYLYEMSMDQAIDFLAKNPEMFKMPLILSDKKILAGYHEKKIKQFIK